MKNKKLLVCMLGLLLVGCGANATTATPTTTAGAKPTTSQVVNTNRNTLTVDKSLELGANLTDKEVTVKNAENEDIKLQITQGRDYAGGIAEIAEEGTIVNLNHFESAEKVTVSFDGKLYVQSGVLRTDFTELTELTSGVEFSLEKKANFIKFTAGEGGARIASINVKYGTAIRTPFESEKMSFNREEETLFVDGSKGKYDTNLAYYKYPDAAIFDNFYLEWTINTNTTTTNKPDSNATVGVAFHNANGSSHLWAGYKANTTGNNPGEFVLGLIFGDWSKGGVYRFSENRLSPDDDGNLNFRVEKYKSIIDVEGVDTVITTFKYFVNKVEITSWTDHGGTATELDYTNATGEIKSIGFSCEEATATFSNVSFGKIEVEAE